MGQGGIRNDLSGWPMASAASFQPNETRSRSGWNWSTSWRKPPEALMRGIPGDAGVDHLEPTAEGGRPLVQQDLEPGRPASLGRAVGQGIAVAHHPDHVRRFGKLHERPLELRH